MTFRREHTGAFGPADDAFLDAAELRRDLDADPDRLLIRGIAAGGVRECYRVSLVDVDRSVERLSIAVAVEQRPFVRDCNDAGEGHPYEIVVAFPRTPVPERVVVRHGDEPVLEARV